MEASEHKEEMNCIDMREIIVEENRRPGNFSRRNSK
jgi:hypothetical protein